MLYEAYFDESGDDGGFPLMLVGGYLILPPNARRLELKWRRLLEEFKLEHFHMVDCAHGNEQFKGMSKGKRIAIQKRFFALINRHVSVSIASCVPLKHFENDVERIGTPFSNCLNTCILGFETLLNNKHEDWKAAVYYENGHRHSGEAMEIFDNASRRGFHEKISSVSSVAKTDSGMIQAADIFAWQFAKYIKGAIENRRLRKDFEFLLNVPGYYLHSFPIGGAILMLHQFNDGLGHPGETEKIKAVYSDRKSLSDYLTKQRGNLIKVG